MELSHVELLRKHESEIFKNYGVHRIGIFGSFAKGTEHEASDIDILVEFSPGKKTFDNYMNLKYFLESLFNRQVDLITSEGLHPHIRDTVLNEVIYAS